MQFGNGLLGVCLGWELDVAPFGTMFFGVWHCLILELGWLVVFLFPWFESLMGDFE